MGFVWRAVGFFVVTGMLVGAGAGCGRKLGPAGQRLRVWSHQGQEAENQAVRRIVEAFNTAHADEGIAVQVEFFPDYQYTEKVSIAAAAGDLPDVLELDGPTVAQFVDAGLLAPLDSWVSPEQRVDFLATILEQGTIDGVLYALGAFDSAMVLYYDKSWLDRAGVEPPAAGAGWAWPDFMAACRALSAAGMEPVSLHMDISADEWFTYAFSPLLWSAGGAMIDPSRDRAEGILNAPGNVAVLRAWQQLFAEGLAKRSPVNPDPFGSGECAMDWSGHWMARSHVAKKGDDLGVMPLPRMGATAAAACGSWCWAVSAKSARPAQAAAWVNWITDPKHGVEPMVRAGGAVPARKSAFEAFPEFGAPPYRLFRTLLEEYGRPRPKTPYYPNLTREVAAALRDIAGGAEVEQRLDRAASAVQRIIDRREGRKP